MQRNWFSQKRATSNRPIQYCTVELQDRAIALNMAPSLETRSRLLVLLRWWLQLDAVTCHLNRNAQNIWYIKRFYIPKLITVRQREMVPNSLGGTHICEKFSQHHRQCMWYCNMHNNRRSTFEFSIGNAEIMQKLPLKSVNFIRKVPFILHIAVSPCPLLQSPCSGSICGTFVHLFICSSGVGTSRRSCSRWSSLLRSTQTINYKSKHVFAAFVVCN